MTSTLWMHYMHAVAALVAATAACAQWSFTLDTTFRTQIVQQSVNAIHVLPDGGIFLSGRIRFPGDMSDRGSAKLMSDGTRDLSFPSFPQTTGSGKITPWMNEQFYVGTTTVRRMLPNGLIDPSFGPIGIGPYYQVFPIGGGDYHVFPDGRVLLSGAHTLSDSIRGFMGQYNLVWFTNTGYLDTTRVHRQANGVIREFKELPDGKFLCSCTCTQYEGQPVSRIFRIHADGSLDTTFQSAITMGNIYEIEPLPDGQVMLGGNFRFSGAPMDTVRLARLHEDGTRDLAFATLAFAGNGDWWSPSGTIVFDIFPFHGGNHIIAGQFTTVDGHARQGLCMLDAEGNLMDAFDGCGVGPFTYQGTTNATPLNVYWDQDSTALYICGAYAGYTDGTTNDPEQRFVSRLLVSELTVEVEEQTGEAVALRLYPNPAAGSTMLALEHVPPAATMLLRDALGRMVLHRAVRHLTSFIDLSDQSEGIYMVEIRSGGRRVATQRLVVQH